MKEDSVYYRKVSRPRTILIIVLLSFYIFAATVFLTIHTINIKDHIMDGPDMVWFDTHGFSSVNLKRMEYYRGGDSLGDSYSLELNIKPDEGGLPDVQVYYGLPT